MVPSTTRITDVPMTTASTTIETSSEYCFHLSQRGRQVPWLAKKASLQFNTVVGFDISVVELFNLSVGHSWDETDQRTHSDFTDHCYCKIYFTRRSVRVDALHSLQESYIYTSK